MIVLDTNVLSELARRQPDPRVLAWVDDQPPGDVYLSAVTAAEIRLGIALLPAGRRRQRIAALMEALLTGTFAGVVLSFDADASIDYADIVARRQRAGRPISALDAQQAAICRRHSAHLATRNVPDFEATGVTVINPWATA